MPERIKPYFLIFSVVLALMGVIAFAKGEDATMVFALLLAILLALWGRS